MDRGGHGQKSKVNLFPVFHDARVALVPKDMIVSVESVDSTNQGGTAV